MTARPISVLILGASGFLGGSPNFHFANDSRLQVTAGSRNLGGDGGFSDYSPDNLARLFDRAEPDYVINCAGVVGHDKVQSNPDAAQVANVEIPSTLADLTARQGIGFVHFSSDAVYSGQPDEAPFSEDSPAAPFSLYGHMKYQSECKVMDQNPNAAVLRVNFFGWSRAGKTGILDYFVARAFSGLQAVGYQNYRATSLYVGELARVCAEMMFAKESGVFNVGSPDSRSKLEFGREVFARIGADSELIVPGDPSIWELEGVSSRDLSMSSAKVEMTLGLSLLSQLEGVSEAVASASDFLRFHNVPRDDPRSLLARSS